MKAIEQQDKLPRNWVVMLFIMILRLNYLKIIIALSKFHAFNHIITTKCRFLS